MVRQATCPMLRENSTMNFNKTMLKPKLNFNSKT